MSSGRVGFLFTRLTCLVSSSGSLGEWESSESERAKRWFFLATGLYDEIQFLLCPELVGVSYGGLCVRIVRGVTCDAAWSCSFAARVVYGWTMLVRVFAVWVWLKGGFEVCRNSERCKLAKSCWSVCSQRAETQDIVSFYLQTVKKRRPVETWDR